jgi:hypothetical protein
MQEKPKKIAKQKYPESKLGKTLREQAKKVDSSDTGVNSFFKSREAANKYSEDLRKRAQRVDSIQASTKNP